jgi:ectoine hydroxylase-related dioxygenase (phytanoyl-CoA dioxygenase family)
VTTASNDPEALPRILDDEQVQQFWRDGYLLIPGVLDDAETAHYRQAILDLLPRDLTVPEHWGASCNRIKPMRSSGDQTMDTPELIPLMANAKLYAAMAQLLESPSLRAFDGSLGITMRCGGHREAVRSQDLHIDASVPDSAANFLGTLEEVQLGGCYYLTDVEPDGGGIHVVPGGHRMVLEEAAAHPNGRSLHANWRRIEHMKSIEVTGRAGDFALLHHLMPHGASYNRRPTARVAQFMRYVREGHPHGADHPKPPERYDAAQLAAMTSLARKLFGLDPWEVAAA